MLFVNICYCGNNIFLLHLLKQEIYDKGIPKEFKNEILTLSKIEHLNLVRFYGFIEHGDERMILVEYVSNGTLREHLDGKPTLFLERAISSFQ